MPGYSCLYVGIGEKREYCCQFNNDVALDYQSRHAVPLSTRRWRQAMDVREISDSGNDAIQTKRLAARFWLMVVPIAAIVAIGSALA